MSEIKLDSLFFSLLLVIPGLLSQLVFNSMVSRGKKPDSRQLELYQSLLHSMAIYVIIYPLIVLFLGADAVNIQALKRLALKNNWTPLLSVLAVAAVSISWGLAYSKFYRSNMLDKFLRRFGRAVEPPNIFFRLFSGEIANSGYWLTIRIDSNTYLEGYLDMDSVGTSPREVYLKNVVYLDAERNEKLSLGEDTGVVVNLDEYSLVEITEIPLNN